MTGGLTRLCKSNGLIVSPIQLIISHFNGVSAGRNLYLTQSNHPGGTCSQTTNVLQLTLISRRFGVSSIPAVKQFENQGIRKTKKKGKKKERDFFLQ